MGESEQATYQMWNERDCREVVDATFTVLAETGCKVDNSEARQLLADAGCAVDGANVKVPRQVMEGALRSVPKTLKLYDRFGNVAIDLKPRNTYFGPVITSVYTYDVKAQVRRYGTKLDARRAVLACDALPHISWASTMAGIFDGVKELADLYEVQTMLPNTVKPFMYWASSLDHLKREFDMFEVVFDAQTLVEKPAQIALVCPMDPLTHTDDGMAQVIYLARRSAPTVYIAGISFGSSGPIALAGNVVVGLADTFIGLLVSQLANPGAPFVASKFTDNLDMRTMTPTHSRPEADQINAATADVFRYLGVPFCLNFGATDSGTFDQVAAFDLAVQLYTAKLAGSNLNFSLGALESGNSSSPMMLAYADAVLSYLDVLTARPPVTPETLAVDEIAEAGPGGNFMMHEATLEHYGDLWVPGVFAPRSFEAYRASGNKDMAVLLDEKIDELVAEGPAHPLDPALVERIDKVMENAERDFAQAAQAK